MKIDPARIEPMRVNLATVESAGVEPAVVEPAVVEPARWGRSSRAKREGEVGHGFVGESSELEIVAREARR